MFYARSTAQLSSFITFFVRHAACFRSRLDAFARWPKNDSTH